MTAKRGRPPKPLEEVKSTRLEIRLTEAEKTEYEAAAESSGLEVSEWIRERLNAATKRSQKGS